MKSYSVFMMATSAPDVTEEEVNYSRFSIGVLKVTPQVLRLVFNNRHPDLKIFLAQNRSKCQQLRNSHVLTKDQWDLLYPATGTAALCDFDTTLLITLLRNLSNITPPSSGWNKDPLQSDTSLGADLLRLRRLRNDHVHCKNMRMTNKDFGKKWSDLTMVLTRRGGLQIQDDMTFYLSRPLEDTDAGRTIEKEIDALRNELKKRIPEKIKERGRKLREKASSLRFLKTKAYRHALKVLQKENVLTITGTIGSGKKTLASQLALRFSKENYTIIPINDYNEIFQYCIEEDNLIFIINDPFGISNLDATTFAKWSKYHDDLCYHIENCARSKVIFTCRLSLFKNERCKSSFDLWYRNSINISEGEYGLTHGEKLSLLSMCDPFIKLNGLPQNMFHILTNPSLPLLCKTNGTRIREHSSHTALDVYVEEIRQLSNTNHTHYLILLLVLARGNHLARENNYRSTINEIVDIFKIPVCLMSPLLQPIDVFLDELDGSFLKETGGIVQFLNDSIYDILAYDASLISKSFTIRVCSRAFFTNNLTFCKDNQNESRLTILLEEEDFDAWFERLQSEISNSRFLDIIFCRAFSEKILKRLLIERMNKLSSFEIMVMSKGTEDDISFLDIIPANIACVLREFSLSEKLNFLCGIVIAGHNDLFSEIWKHIKKSKVFKGFDKDDLLKAAVIGGNVKNLKRIAKFWKRKIDLPFVNSMDRRFFKNLLASYWPVCVSSACNNLELIHYFKELNFDVNERSDDGDTPLTYAARFGNVDAVRCLLSFGNIDINTQNKYGKSPLMWAVENDEIFDILLKSGADLNPCTNEGENVLMIACGLGKTKIVTEILKTVKQSLSRGEQESFINQRKVNGVTALHKACECEEKEDRFQIVHLLLMANANPQTSDVFQLSSPLHLASALNDSKLVNLLLYKRNKDVNCVDKDGVTPLFLAAENCFPRIVSLLLDHGANPLQSRLTDRATPLLISAERGHLEVVRILLEIKGIEMVINRGNFQNSTPLLLATLNDNTQVCELLLHFGADVNTSNENGYDPILVASRNGNTKLIHMYLQRGANINSLSIPDHNTPLHLAAMMGNKRATKYLLTHGADPEIKNNEGLTSSVIATYRKQDEISSLLFRFRMFGLDLAELHTPSVESPHTPTSSFSSDPSILMNTDTSDPSILMNTDTSDPSILMNTDTSDPSILMDIDTSELPTLRRLVRVPSRISIASGSASSIVYSDRGSSIGSTSSLV